jgi:molybdopterin synthase catalytic subunit
MIDVRIQSTLIDAGKQGKRLAELGKAGVASFAALLEADEEVSEIFIDHYPALAKTVLNSIAADAAERFGLAGTIIIHRHGRMKAGEAALFVGVAASDRRAAIEALSFIAEEIRTRAPFWKQERLADGSSRWR